METEDSTFKMALKPGLIIGGISIAISLVLWATISDLDIRQKAGYITWLIVAFLYHYYTKLYRENTLDGAIAYGKAFTFMFFITIVSSVLATIYAYVLFAYIDPGMVDLIKDQAAEKLYQQGGLSEEQIDQAIEVQSKWISPGIMSIGGFFASMFFGTILSLVVAIFVKKDVEFIED